MELRIHILKELDCLSQDKGFVVLYNIMRAMVSYKLGRRCQNHIIQLSYQLFISNGFERLENIGLERGLGNQSAIKNHFLPCHNYMFNFVLENNNLYRLDAYDLSRDFRKVSGDGFFFQTVPLGGGCITKTAEATVEATFIIRVATAKYGRLDQGRH